MSTEVQLLIEHCEFNRLRLRSQGFSRPTWPFSTLCDASVKMLTHLSASSSFVEEKAAADGADVVRQQWGSRLQQLKDGDATIANESCQLRFVNARAAGCRADRKDSFGDFT